MRVKFLHVWTLGEEFSAARRISALEESKIIEFSTLGEEFSQPSGFSALEESE